MEIQLTKLYEDTGTLEVMFGQDDSFTVGGYGERNGVVLELPLYGHEAATIRDALAPLAARKEDDDG